VVRCYRRQQVECLVLSYHFGPLPNYESFRSLPTERIPLGWSVTYAVVRRKQSTQNVKCRAERGPTMTEEDGNGPACRVPLLARCPRLFCSGSCPICLEDPMSSRAWTKNNDRKGWKRTIPACRVPLLAQITVVVQSVTVETLSHFRSLHSLPSP
jgi:hypothetical protein